MHLAYSQRYKANRISLFSGIGLLYDNVQRTVDVGNNFTADMRINLGGADTLVADKFLNISYINYLFEKMGSLTQTNHFTEKYPENRCASTELSPVQT